AAVRESACRNPTYSPCRKKSSSSSVAFCRVPLPSAASTLCAASANETATMYLAFIVMRQPCRTKSRRQLPAGSSYFEGETALSSLAPHVRRFAPARARGATTIQHTASIRESVADDAPQGLETVPPADLLPLLIRAAGVADRMLVDAQTPPRNLGGDFRFEPESVLLQRWQDFFDHFAAENLVAGLHVGQVEIRETV